MYFNLVPDSYCCPNKNFNTFCVAWLTRIYCFLYISLIWLACSTLSFRITYRTWQRWRQKQTNSSVRLRSTVLVFGNFGYSNYITEAVVEQACFCLSDTERITYAAKVPITRKNALVSFACGSVSRYFTVGGGANVMADSGQLKWVSARLYGARSSSAGVV